MLCPIYRSLATRIKLRSKLISMPQTTEIHSLRIGLFFGSFNPVHNGHLAIADYMLSHTDIDRLWWVVSPCNPFKKESDLLSDKHRLEMVKLAIADRANMEVSDVEIHLPRPSYTIHTMDYLEEHYPNHTFVILMGSDGLEKFDQWKSSHLLVKRYKRYVYPRPDTPTDLLAHISNGELIPAPQMPISSTIIRNRIQQGLPLQGWVPAAVERYITQLALYV